MTLTRRFACLAGALALGALAPLPVLAQQLPNAEMLLDAQREAMKPLARMDGTWRGPAWTLLADGSRHEITQTERIGPFLGGAIKLIEGRGHEADGRISFRAFAVVSYDTRAKTYQLQSHAQGRGGNFAFAPTADGYTWTVPMGGNALIRYTAVIRDGELLEVGDEIVPGQEPKRFFEMRLKRLGDSAWPEAGAVPQR
jgi:hypothetical protein